MYWKNFFDSTILERGYDYYTEGLVEGLTKKSNILNAKVNGTHKYTVKVELDENDEVGIIDAECNCPYAQTGFLCKHVAAVLFEYFEKFIVNEETTEDVLFKTNLSDKEFEIKKAKIEELIDNADYNVLKEYLIKILMSNRELLSSFYGAVNKEFDDVDLEHYYKIIDKIFENNLYGYEYIYDDNIFDFEEELNKYIIDVSDILIQNKNNKAAFRINSYIFNKLIYVDTNEDYYYILLELGQGILDSWKNALKDMNIKDKIEIFNEFIEEVYYENYNAITDYCDYLLFQDFNDKELSKYKLSFILAKINEIDKLNNDQNSWYRRSCVNKWVIACLELYKNNNYPKKDIESLCNSFFEYPKVKLFYINYCIDEKEYEKALDLIDEILVNSQDKDFITEIIKIKKNLYLSQNKKSEYIKVLWEMVTEYKICDLDIYKELKSQYSKEKWDQLRFDAYYQISDKYLLCKIYFEDEAYDKLLELVINSDHLYLLMDYFDILSKLYPRQVLGKFVYELNKMAYKKGSRSNYREIVDYLRIMKKIDGGELIVDDLITKWKDEYKGRPAFIDEIKKV